MSTIGLAPRIVVDGPLPRPRLFGLTSVATEVTGDDPYWRAGANIYPYPAALPTGQDPCLDGTWRAKDEPTEVTLPEAFPAWTAYLGDICTASGISDWDTFRARVNVALAAREGWALERQLVDAQFVDAPHLGDDNVDLLASGAAVAVEVALAYLEDAIAATGQDGVIHLTAAAAAYLGTQHLVNDRGTLRTVAGTPVAIGAGYTGSDTPTSGGTTDTAAGAGQSWLYATGPILYRRDPTIFSLPETLGEALDRSDNTVIYRAERDLWVGWDGQLQAAVLADWSPV